MAVMVSGAMAFEYGPVRDVLVGNKLEPVTINEATTKVVVPDSIISNPFNTKQFVSMCKTLGGDNLYAVLQDGTEAPWFNKDGSYSEYAEVFRSFFPSLDKENVFKSEKPYPWVCKKENNQLFTVTRKTTPYRNNQGAWFNVLYTFVHNPEKPTSFAPKGIMDSNNDSALKQSIAKRTAQIKSDFVQIKGNIQYVGTYNGVNNVGCDLVSVLEKTTAVQSVETYNYKVCKNKVSSLGKSGPALKFPQGLENTMIATAKACQQSGIANSGYDNYILTCKALIDKDKCSVEVSILNEQDQLVDKRIMNGCN
jgi:hypothetical protein